MSTRLKILTILQFRNCKLTHKLLFKITFEILNRTHCGNVGNLKPPVVLVNPVVMETPVVADRVVTDPEVKVVIQGLAGSLNLCSKLDSVVMT